MQTLDLKENIYQNIQNMPNDLLLEINDFVEFLKEKRLKTDSKNQILNNLQIAIDEVKNGELNKKEKTFEDLLNEL